MRFFENLALTVLPDTAATITFAHIEESAERTYQASEPFDRIGRAGMCHVAGADHTESLAPARKGLEATAEMWARLADVGKHLTAALK